MKQRESLCRQNKQRQLHTHAPQQLHPRMTWNYYRVSRTINIAKSMRLVVQPVFGSHPHSAIPALIQLRSGGLQQFSWRKDSSAISEGVAVDM
eukprot:1924171-Amphidinium_carterae.1